MTTRHKILALHGFAQTGQTFSKKAGALRKALDKLNIDILFPTAPHKILPADASFPGEREKLLEAEKSDAEWQYWGWAFADEETHDMRLLDQSVKFIGKILEEQVPTSNPRRNGTDDEGPFVGIIGFSQGAAVAALVAGMLEGGSRQTLFERIQHPPVKFLVSFSGFRMRFEKYDQFYPVHTPSLHVIGTLDTVVVESRMIALLDACTNSQVIKHPGGHFIPNAANIRHEIVQFIDKNLKTEEEVNGEINGHL